MDFVLGVIVLIVGVVGVHYCNKIMRRNRRKNLGKMES